MFTFSVIRFHISLNFRDSFFNFMSFVITRLEAFSFQPSSLISREELKKNWCLVDIWKFSDLQPTTQTSSWWFVFCLESWNPRFEMYCLVRLFLLLFLKLLILYVKANSFHLRDLKATPTTYMISRSFFLRIISNSVEQNRTDVCNYFNYILMKVFNSDQMHNFL